MKRTLKTISIILTATVFAVSCNKENLKEALTQQDDSSKIVEILSYANESELNAALHEIAPLSQAERIAKEEAQGFKSFGTIAQEFYETIDPEQFQSLEEIKAFVAQHSEYIQLIPEKNGEFTLEIIAYRNPYRYLANKNGEIEVGGNICNVTEELVVNAKTRAEVAASPFKESVAERSISTKNVKESDVSETDNNETVESNKQLIGSRFYATPSSGRDRVVVDFRNTVLVPGRNSFPILTYYRVQPYKRTMGVWFQCGRTLTMDIQFNGVLRIGYTNYPFTQNVTETKAGRSLGDATTAKQLVVPNAPWNTNFQITTISYRFKGSSASGVSREWIYKP